MKTPITQLSLKELIKVTLGKLTIKIKLCCILSFLLSSPSTLANNISHSEIPQVQVSLGEKIAFHSKYLNEERAFYVRLPDNYQQSKKNYPVIYLLDANNETLTYMDNLYFHSVTQIERLMKHEDIPESIIIGIPFKRNQWFGNVINYPSSFRDYLTKEVLSYVNDNYRTSASSSLIGQSYSAVFVINSLPNNDGLFSNFIAIEPVLSNGELEKAVDNYQKNEVENATLQIIMGGDHLLHEAQELVRQIDSSTNKNVDISLESFPTESHGSVYYPALNSGLRKQFQDYRLPDKSTILSGKFGHQELLNYFDKRAAKYHVTTTEKQFQSAVFEVIFSQLMVKDFKQAFDLWPVWQSKYKTYNANRIVNHFTRNNDNASAINFLLYLTKAMPKSVNTLDQLAALYLQDKQEEQADKYHNQIKNLLAETFSKPLSSQQEDDMNRYGYYLLNKKRNDEAIVIFEKISQANPESINAFDSLAEAYATADNVQGAITSLEQAIKLAKRKEGVSTVTFSQKLQQLKTLQEAD